MPTPSLAGHGSCDPTTGACACDGAWSGPACDMRSCAANCSDHGECDRASGTCRCKSGWGGALCERPGCPIAANALECGGRGWCNVKRRFCVCAIGWRGFDCSEPAPPVCPRGCGGHGRCQEQSSGNNDGGSQGGGSLRIAGELASSGCICDIGFHGLDCSRQDCPLNCSSHGACAADGRCKPPNPYSCPPTVCDQRTQVAR